MSRSRAKRTCLFALQMSGYDPKRTWVPHAPAPFRWGATLSRTTPRPEPRRGNETARVRQAYRLRCRDGGMSAWGACAATENAGGRISQCRITRRIRSLRDWVPPWLNESGYVEGKNVTIDYQWARGQYDRLQVMAADLVRRKVAVIAANTPAAPVAKAATTRFRSSSLAPAIRSWLASSASSSDSTGNATGVGLLGMELEGKRLGLLHQFVLEPPRLAALVDPMNPAANLQLRELQETAGAIKRQIDILRASTALDIERLSRAPLNKRRPRFSCRPIPFYNSQRDQLVALAADQKPPVMYPLREFAEIGGLVRTNGTRPRGRLSRNGCLRWRL